jgi:predicted Zn-dependent protease
MSFEVVCSGCGAPSSPSVGVCPFCKTVMSVNDGKEKHTVDVFTKLYNEGKLERALSLGNEMYKSKPDLKSDLVFVITFSKILIESEAPSSQIKSLLAEAHLHTPQNTDISDYLEIVEARNCLKKGINDTGEMMLKNLLRRSPNNVHAHFILGTHLFWTDNESTMAIPHLETCVRLHTHFLRAWGCLGAIYKKMGNTQLAQMAFQKCATIETNQNMKDFFLSQTKTS